MDGIATFGISRVPGSAELGEITARLLAQLPSWFAIPEANAAYAASATRLPGLVAHTDTEGTVGVLLYRRHFAEAAEIHLMAVDPSWHRRGVGTALVDAVGADLSTDGCRVLQVKTLGSAHPDPGYAATRAFYRAAGFLPLEETTDLWPRNPCLLMVKWLAVPS